MYVRLGLANPKEGMTEEALNYFRDVAIPVYDQVSGLLGACLLYTSPSPRDATLSRMPSSA